MDNTEKSQSISEQLAASDILEKLDNYGTLSHEYDRYMLLQENIEKHRQSTRSHIYKKVKDEYLEKCTELEKDRKKLETLLQNQLHTLLKEKKTLNKFCQDKSDYLEEIDLRIRIGEKKEEEFSKERNDLKENLLNFTQELGKIEEFITKYSEVGLYQENQNIPSTENEKASKKLQTTNKEHEATGTKTNQKAAKAEESHKEEIKVKKETKQVEEDTDDEAVKNEALEDKEEKGKEEIAEEEKVEQDEAEEEEEEEETIEGPLESEATENFLVVETDHSPTTEDCPIVQCPTSISSDNSSDPNRPKKTDQSKNDSKNLLNDFVTGYLISLEGSRKNERFPLISSNITLGNSPGIDIRLRDPGIANFHARIQYKDRKHYLENLDTMGRCFVNGVQAKFIELKDGDVIRLGEIKMQVEYATPDKSDLNGKKKKRH